MNYFKSIDNKVVSKSEEEDIKNMIRITEEEYNQFINMNKQKMLTKIRINQLKKMLADTDYQAIKYAEGLLTEEQYTPIKAQRQAWRDEINQLENETQN